MSNTKRMPEGSIYLSSFNDIKYFQILSIELDQSVINSKYYLSYAIDSNGFIYKVLYVRNDRIYESMILNQLDIKIITNKGFGWLLSLEQPPGYPEIIKKEKAMKKP